MKAVKINSDYHYRIKELEKQLKAAHSALKIIRTLASFDDGSALVPKHVERLCLKGLGYDDKPA